MKKVRQKTHMFIAPENKIMSVYLFIMLGIFPVYYRYQYSKMGDKKYELFRNSSIACVVALLLLVLLQIFLKSKKEGVLKVKKNTKSSFSLLDKGVLIYFACTSISYLFCNFKQDGFYGASGWNMGYLSQILFVAVYFMIAKGWAYQEGYIWLLLVTSGFVFLVGVLHRFDVDILGIYGDLQQEYKVQFLSTMGQSSWYSSFLCSVFPLGLYLFFMADTKWIRRASGVYSVVAMLTLVTQNTDSAFLCLFAVLLLLFYLSFDGYKEKLRFWEVLILVFGSFTFMGICQRILAKSMIPLDALSVFMSQGILSPVLLMGSVIVYVLTKKRVGESPKALQKSGRKPFWILLVVLGVLGAGAIVFIILNSTGVLYTHFGYRNENNYLLFADDWGNARGFAWRFTCEAYLEQPFLQKIIGVGPDCYSFYNAAVPKYAEQMQEFWGTLTLTNAHNEYLTKLYNLGILGLLSYVFMLGSAIYLFVKNRKEHILLPAFALCTVSYMTHLIFCYEQVCCTPVFYILLGIGSNLIHNKWKKSTY